jgi:Holliday junction DNA helicase RuvA
MICHLGGTLVEKHPTRVVVEVGGIGFSVHIPLSSYERLGEIGDTVTVLTHLHVRDDALQLYGFVTRDEIELFELLLAVSGVGPRLALSILSGRSVAEFRRSVAEQDVDSLSTIPGIGRKTAQRLVFELREKMAGAPPSLVETATQAFQEAEAALVSLGYRGSDARRLIRRATKSLETTASVEDIIKTALREGA